MTGAAAAAASLGPPIVADWANTTGEAGDPQTNQNVTMMAAGTLKITGIGGLNFRYVKNDGAASVPMSNGDEFSVAQADTIHFLLSKPTSGTGTVTISNSTFNNEVVDTFTYELT